MKRIFCCVLLAAMAAACGNKPTPPPEPAAPAVRNILLITIDTVRADALHVYGGSTPTPFLDGFAQHAAVFDHALTSAPITLPAHTSLMTGLYPPLHGVRNNGTYRAASSLKTLAEYAGDHGLATGAVIGGYPLAAQFGLNQGFRTYDDSFPPQPSAPGIFLYTEKSAEQVRQSAEQWLSHATAPYLLWLHFFDPHHPYLEHGMQGLAPYQQEIAYVDQQLQLLFQFLKARKLDEKTLIIIASDHGEAFGEHGEVSHTLFVYNTTLHVPLMISGPGIAAARIPQVVRLVDVLPTVLEVMGWKSDASMDGASLLPILQGRPGSPRDSYAETFAPALDFGWSPLASLQDERYKYIRAPRAEFYDLKADPSENKSIQNPAAAQPYSKKLDALLNRTPAADSQHAPTPEEREKLASIGYLSGGHRLNWKGADPKDRVEAARQIAELAVSALPLPDKARAYEALAASDPGNPLLLLRYAEILLKLQKYAQATSVYQRVLDLEYPSASLYNGMATAYFFQNKINDAENLLLQAEKTGNADGESFYNLGEIQFNRGDRDGAIARYDRAIALDYAPAFYRKARILALMAEQDQALQLLRSAEKKFPSDMQANFDIGMLLFRNHDFAGAVAEFEAASRKAPGEISLEYNLGIAYMRLGNNEAARSHLRQFLQQAPTSMKDERREAAAALKQLGS